MRVISRKRLQQFWLRHPDAEMPLRSCYQLITGNQFQTFADLRSTFGSADLFKRFTIFNIAGNHYRLIASIHYKSQLVFVRTIMTHNEYDQEKWKNDCS